MGLYFSSRYFSFNIGGQPNLEARQSVVVGRSHVQGKRITPTFESMVKTYQSDPHVRAAIDNLGETAVGLGFWISGKDKDAITACEYFCEDVDLDGINQNVAKELWLAGNSLFEKEDLQRLKLLYHVPISSVVKFYTDWHGNLLAIDQRKDGKNKKLEAESLKKIVWLKWNTLDASLRGIGLLESLMNQGIGYTWTDGDNKTHIEYRPSFLEIKEEIEDAMRKVVVRYVPRFAYKFRGFNADKVAEHGKVIRNLRPSDDPIIGMGDLEKQDVAIERLSTDPRSRLEAMIEHFVDGIHTGLETPVLKLFLEAGFTEASARTAVNELYRKEAAFQRMLRRTWERELFKTIIMQKPDSTGATYGLGYDLRQWREAKVRLRWEQDIDLALVLQGHKQSGISKEELRRAFEKKGLELFEGGTFVEPTRFGNFKGE